MLAYLSSLSFLTMVDIIEKARSIVVSFLVSAFAMFHSSAHMSAYSVVFARAHVFSSVQCVILPCTCASTSIQCDTYTLLPIPYSRKFWSNTFLVYVFCGNTYTYFIIIFFFSISFLTDINLAERQLQHLKLGAFAYRVVTL